MHAVFIEPSFPANQKQFVRALHEAGAKVTGIGERPKDALDSDLRRWLLHYEQVGSVVDAPRITEIVRAVSRRLPVDRLEATIEAHTLAAAQVREALGISGTSVHTTWLCRDKPAMKEALREAGVPCAQSIGSGDREEIRAFVADVGYPLVVKPRAGAGAAGTARVDSDEELAHVLDTMGVGRGGNVAVEEFIEGHEGFYDTITIGGSVAHEFISHYYPNVLEAMRTRWISPQIVTTNRIASAPAYQEVLEMGRKVIRALGIDTAPTHMEWFYGPKGLRFSEIGCRPPGVRWWDVYAAANEIDIYHEWAMAVLYGRTGRKASRKYAGGMIAVRPDRDGSISHYEGVQQLQDRYGEWIIDAHLPAPGTPTQPVEAGYLANAWVRMRHPDYDTLRGMLDDVGQTLKVRAS
ncbi:MAG: ATP-grasp domain-containing protein [Longimicrobiales bacterium]|nr:ATP-grasp domain-containing protein [Longimicrobiales bacterium]